MDLAGGAERQLTRGGAVFGWAGWMERLVRVGRRRRDGGDR